MSIIIGGIVDYNFCTSRVAVGGIISCREALLELKTIGITHIINCQSDHNDAELFELNDNFRYLWIGVHDDGFPKPVEWFKTAIDFALPALAQPNTKLYIHCYAGINRGPSIAYSIFRAFGLSQMTASNLIKNVRPFADIIYKKDADAAIKALGYE